MHELSIQDPSTVIESSEMPTKSRYLPITYGSTLYVCINIHGLVVRAR